MTKYPEIKDVYLRAAVHQACRDIRDTAYFNKAVECAAEEYGYDFEVVAAEVRKRQAAGQRGKTRSLKPYLVGTFLKTDENQKKGVLIALTLKKASSAEGAVTNWDSYNKLNQVDASYSTIRVDRIIRKYKTKKEAEDDFLMLYERGDYPNVRFVNRI